MLSFPPSPKTEMEVDRVGDLSVRMSPRIGMAPLFTRIAPRSFREITMYLLSWFVAGDFQFS